MSRLPALTDMFNRHHTYLRISLTERCNLRCTYCMPEEGVPLSPKEDILTTPEILKLATLFVNQGVTKIRLTGGEPTIRPDLFELMTGLSGLRNQGLKAIGMTSNGIALKRKLPKLLEYGLTSLNLSLDTINPFKFQILTRRKGFEKVIESLDLAESLGIQQLKVNCVVMRGVNDMEVVDFVQLSEDRNLSIRFIEYMPFDGNRWNDKKMVPYKELLAKITAAYPNISKVQDDPNDTTKHYRVAGFKGNFGFISSMTDHFCGTCNRLRITADGNIKACLFGAAEVSLRDMMRGGSSDEDLLAMISAVVKKKKPKHAAQEFIPRLTMPSSFAPLIKTPFLNKAPIFRNNQSMRSQSSDARLSHIDPSSGKAKMVDVGDKAVTKRVASAQSIITLSLAAFRQIRDPNKPYHLQDGVANKKGDVLTVAQIAGIQAAKMTSSLIPLCHPLQINKADVDFELRETGDSGEVIITATVSCQGKTGVEMEALTAASVAALTVFDMCKAVDPRAVISGIHVIRKSGGRSGSFEQNGS
ncbi:hypothetical protein DSO57_1004013 [Entomophthora muscae]|uniref:Uncharacterized protein n=1 Tax=Entomophthora muscae TaxID=34485 RepID=A0ACC2SL12_9FUNG|nr:hypothetical protein DSO57_1004013 [Entomophthora muscae]